MPVIKFNPVIRRARISVPGYSPETMLQLGRAMLDSIKTRLDRAQNIYDQSAPPLKAHYSAWKVKARGGQPVRDLRLTGFTRRRMAVIEAGQNYCVIGFTDPEAARRIYYNNLRSRQWGVSPQDERNFRNALLNVIGLPVTVEYSKVG